MTIRPARLDDLAAIKEIAAATDMFGPDEVGLFDEMLAGALDGSMEGHAWLVAADEDRVTGAAYYAPEPFADRMWDLYFLSVDPSRQSEGVGASLVAHVESTLRDAGPDVAQTLVVETSSTDQYARTRAFYEREGFVEEARIRRFYGPDDHKVVFWKSLTD